ncbi:hypothetical protein MACK_003276 [Theileria orientalis]|uniref:Uncharacterized protein n=1 Tax=Theileria orientalis TaxID=68886 RepID=A0A976XIY2_THEOR|nr:hypothetical protein MACK_003276 [Theileria orientalis]
MKDTEFTKYKYKNDHHIFIAKEPFLVTAIRRGFTFLWHSTKDKYPNVVVIYPKENETRRLRLFYPGQNSGFIDPEDEPSQEKPQQLRGYVQPNKQKNHYSVQTIDVDKSNTILKTKKVKQHDSDESVESDPEPATDIEIELTDEPETEESPQIQPQPQQVPKLQKETPQPPNKKPNNLVRLDINDRWSDQYVEYIWDDTSNADVFVARPPYLLSTITYGNEILWRKRDGDYPYSVSVTRGKDGLPNVRVYFPGAKPLPLQQPKKKPNNLVRLDINDKWSDQYVEYMWDNTSNADVFVARPPYLLSTIVDGNEILWRKRDGEYPYAVAVINPGTDNTLVRTFS